MKRFPIGGHNIAYRDEGSGPIVVFVHGTPSSSAEYADVIETLRSSFRCIALDLLGFGDSDKPAVADYSIAAHRRRLAALLGHLEVGGYHLVVHDFGGAIALPLAIESPERILSITLINTWLWPLGDTEPALRRQRLLLRSPLMKWLYRYFNFSARVLVKSAWGTYRPLSADRHRRYQDAFKSPDERWGTIAFLDALLDDREPAWQAWRNLQVLARTPALLLWGMADRMIGRNTLRRWTQLWPHAAVIEMKDVGHFAAEEAPELVADALRRFMTEVEGRAAALKSA